MVLTSESLNKKPIEIEKENKPVKVETKKLNNKVSEAVKIDEVSKKEVKAVEYVIAEDEFGKKFLKRV